MLGKESKMLWISKADRVSINVPKHFYSKSGRFLLEYTKNYSTTPFPSGPVRSLFIEAVQRFERSSNNV